MELEDKLKYYFGYEDFRPFQESIIKSILDKKNVIAILPTGGGKSLCYQLPAIVSSKFSIVISPLIALMKDQTDSLNKKERIAGFINSTLTYVQSEEILREIYEGRIKLLYIAPEKLESREFILKLKNLCPEFLFVDEAHCISQWGHNFRPSYMKIRSFADELNIKNISAFTATATPEVVEDIIKKLDLKDPVKFIRGFQRDNLAIQVIECSDKNSLLPGILSQNNSSAIIYTSSRKSAEEVSDFINRSGFVSRFYHAGLSGDVRQMIQDSFLDGSTRIVCATNAFGMGIDKKDISLVIHYNMPGSIENYYQEIGRAGRDGSQSKAILLYDKKDKNIHNFFIANTYPDEQTVREIYNALCDYGEIAVGSNSNSEIPVDLNYLKKCTNRQLSYSIVSSAVKALEINGYLRAVSEHEKKYALQINIPATRINEYLEKIDSSSVKNILMLIIRNYGSLITQKKHQIFIDKLSDQCEVSREYLLDTLALLNSTGIIEFDCPSDRETVRLLSARVSTRYILLNLSDIEAQKEMAISKLEQMEEFTATDTCRMKFITDYFGENDETYKCGKCDNCNPESFNEMPIISPVIQINEDKAANQDYENDLVLFNKLRKLRNEAAVKFQQSPLFICSDEIIRKIAEIKPTRTSDLMNIPGFNSRIYNKIGRDLIETVKEHLGN